MKKKKRAAACYRCQFCGKDSPRKLWKKDICPKCKRKYDAILAQDGDD